MDFLATLKGVMTWAVIISGGYLIGRVVYALIKKPSLRLYVWKTLKDMKHMYYRYHV